jgi:hypothetical protein
MNDAEAWTPGRLHIGTVALIANGMLFKSQAQAGLGFFTDELRLS